MPTIFGIKFMKQGMMRKVLIALIPILIASVYYFGWRSIIMLAVVSIAGTLAEYAFKRNEKKTVSEAVFVSCFLFTLTLPPSTPYWIAAVGIIFGIVFGKEVFGGFGRNVFNPALVGRAFIYVSFPKFMTIQWTQAATHFPGGLVKYINAPIDTISTATPMLTFRSTGEMMDYGRLLMGNVSGSLGETSALLILLAAVYLIYTKTASWQIMAGMTGGFLIFDSFMHYSGIVQVPNPVFGLLSGGFLFAVTFMATDPISGPKTVEAKWIYGALIGVVTVVIRGFALFAGGVMFAILVGNTFSPILDETVKYVKAQKKNKKRGAANG